MLGAMDRDQELLLQFDNVPLLFDLMRRLEGAMARSPLDREEIAWTLRGIARVSTDNLDFRETDIGRKVNTLFAEAAREFPEVYTVT